MRALIGDPGDELGELLVGEVPGALGPAVVQDEGLVEAVGLDPPELLGGLLLGAVTAVAEQRDVVRTCLTKVFAELPDDHVAGRLLIDQGLQFQDVVDPALARIDSGFEVLPHLINVVDATPEFGNRGGIVIDPNQQGVNHFHDACPGL